MDTIKHNFQGDIDQISKNIIVPSLLEVVCKTTGMGFAAIARVTSEHWVTCGVRDEINFGLKIGDELKVDTTICHEIRQSGDEVVIDHVSLDEFYNVHHTPLMYGFQSYISVPIKLKDQRFFGTLCAIDPSPAILNTPEIVGMFKTYAGLISIHLHAADILSESKLIEIRAITSSAINQELLILENNGVFNNPRPEFKKGEMPHRDKNIAQAIIESSERIKKSIGQLNSFI